MAPGGLHPPLWAVQCQGVAAHLLAGISAGHILSKDLLLAFGREFARGEVRACSPLPNAGRCPLVAFGLVPTNMSQQRWLQVGVKHALRALVPLQCLLNTSPVLHPCKKDQTIT